MNPEEFYKTDFSKREDLNQSAIGFSKANGLGKLLEIPCKKCNAQTVYCNSKDLGTVDHYDNYCHVCLTCLDGQHEEVYCGATQEGGLEGICTFCPRDTSVFYPEKQDPNSPKKTDSEEDSPNYLNSVSIDPL